MKISEVYSSMALLLSPTYGTYFITTYRGTGKRVRYEGVRGKSKGRNKMDGGEKREGGKSST